ncbi:MAG: lipoyl(octanoyl) transferase LipB, partial [Dehalococcoidia bacterium]
AEGDRAALGLPYYRVDRGGDVMYLGPGHLVAYPVLRLADHALDPLQYLRALEQTVIQALDDFGIRGRRIPGLTGVWVREAKIAGVAVKVARGVTTHGFNLNVSPDLSYYRYIVTCGNHGRDVTSMEQLLGAPPDLTAVEERVVAQFANVFGLEAVP